MKRLRDHCPTIFASLQPLFQSHQDKLKAEGRWPRTKDEQAHHTFQADLFGRSYDRTHVPLFERLIGLDTTTPLGAKEKKKYIRWCELLYEDVENKHGKGLFRNPALLIVSQWTRFGR